MRAHHIQALPRLDPLLPSALLVRCAPLRAACAASRPGDCAAAQQSVVQTTLHTIISQWSSANPDTLLRIAGVWGFIKMNRSGGKGAGAAPPPRPQKPVARTDKVCKKKNAEGRCAWCFATLCAVLHCGFTGCAALCCAVLSGGRCPAPLACRLSRRALPPQLFSSYPAHPHAHRSTARPALVAKATASDARRHAAAPRRAPIPASFECMAGGLTQAPSVRRPPGSGKGRGRRC